MSHLVRLLQEALTQWLDHELFPTYVPSISQAHNNGEFPRVLRHQFLGLHGAARFLTAMKELVSSIPRLTHNASNAQTAPGANGTRHPQSDN